MPQPKRIPKPEPEPYLPDPDFETRHWQDRCETGLCTTKDDCPRRPACYDPPGSL